MADFEPKSRSQRRSTWGLGLSRFAADRREPFSRDRSPAKPALAVLLALAVLFPFASWASETIAGDLVITTNETWSTDHHILGSLTVSNGATLTLENNFVHTVTGNVLVETGGTISADGRGHGSNSGPGAGTTATSGGGGGHGGNGGAGGSGASGGGFNDSGFLPALPGSGGGSGIRTAGGSGGGVIRLSVGGACQLDGTLSANGANAASNNNGGVGGGGAGGAIRLACNTLSGSGLLRANGGDGGADPTVALNEDGRGGGGGGGRIAVRASDHSGFVSKASAEAEAGAAGSGVGPAGIVGGRGTVVFITVGAGANPLTDNTKSHDTDLELYRSWRWEPSVEGAFDYQSVTVKPDTQVVGGDGDVTVTAETFTMDTASWDTTVSSSNETPSSGSVHLDVTTLGLTGSTLVADASSKDWDFAVTSTPTLSGVSLSGQNVTFNGDVDLAFTDSTLTAGDQLQLTANNALSFANSTQLAGAQITLTAASLSQDATTVFSADGQGHGPDTGPGAGTTGTSGGGGGHGGDGGDGASGASGGGFNDSGFLPALPGSGGGSGIRTAGGSGGGVIRLSVGGACQLDGTLSTNGENATSNNNGATGGGGAGGAIRLACNTLSGSGLLRANGGDGGDDPTVALNEDGRGGGGGGGRIAVRASDHSGFVSKASAEAEAGAAGSGVGPAGIVGGRGTVVFITVGAGANPLTDNTKSHDTDLELYRSWRWEPSVEGAFDYQSVTVKPDTQVVGGDGDVTVTAETFTMDTASWDTTVSSSNETPSSGSVHLDVTTLGLTGSTLVADASSKDWDFAVTSTPTLSGVSLSGQNVTFNGDVDLAFTGSTLTAGDQLQLTANNALSFANSTQLAGAQITLTAASLSQDATTVFSADGQGHGPDTGPGAGTTGTSGGGGGHGGDGGDGASGASGGDAYDIELFPALPGSGGGSGIRTAGGSGGGVIRLSVGGACQLDGTLSTNGENATSNNNGATGGGGAGGAIRLACNTLSGSGLLRANGGDGGDDPTVALNEDGGGGGGGGGRIAVHFATSTFSNQAGISVAGGLAGAGVGPAGSPGSAGTLFFGSLPSTTWVVSGSAQGGEIAFEILGISLQITTTPGQSAEQVTTALAAAITSEPGLAGIEANVTGTTLVITAPVSVPVDADAGIQIGVTGDVVIAANETWSTDHHILGSLTVSNGATLTLENNFGHSVTGNVLVEANGTISADGQGRGPESGPGAGTTGTSGGGGGHGGDGGDGASGASGGFFNDSGLLPALPGSGGGNGLRTLGGSGGGVIRLSVGGACQLDGTLSANGANAASNNNGATGGGGAGGTIRLACDTLSGSGLLRANGGDGGDDPTVALNEDGGGGGGGGGRIAVRASDHSGFVSKASAEAEAGAAGAGVGPAGVAGGRGTVVFITVGAGANPLTDDTKAHDTDLELYRSWRWEPSIEGAFDYSVEGTFDYDSVTVKPDTQVVAGDGDVTVTAETFTMDTASWDTTVSSSNGTTAAGNVHLIVTALGLTDSTLVTDASTKDWSVAVSASSNISGGSIVGQNVTFTGTGNLEFVNSMQLTADQIELAGNSFSQDATTVFSTDGLGHGPEGGPQAGTTDTNGGGGGHGGVGGDGASGASGGFFNDSGLLPALPGSGGGNGLRTLGGSGGGVIRLSVGGACQLDGTLSANGANAASNNNGATGGGGAGGTIRLACDTLSGSGLLRANGGDGGDDPTVALNEDGGGGGGGGGRIAVRASDHSGFVSKASAEAEAGAAGAGVGPAGVAGGRGTVAFITVAAGTYSLDEDAGDEDIGDDDTDLELYRSWRWEPSVEGTFAYDSVTVMPDTQVVGGDGGDVSIAATNFSISSASWDTTVASSNGTAFSSGNVRLEVTKILVMDSVIVADSASNEWAFTVLSVFGMSASTLEGRTVQIEGNGSLVFENGSQLTADQIELAGDSFSQDATTVFSTDGLGYGAGPGAGATGTNGAGGGHGGDGGDGAGGVSGGNAYDIELFPVEPGSGGGDGARTDGGSGGGVIFLSMEGACQLDGTLSANGENAANNDNGATGGGGAGGSLLVECNTLSGSGLLRANGGDGGADPTAAGPEDGRGGGGGGGRIAVHFATSTFSNQASISVAGGLAGAGVGPAGSPGSAGTLFFFGSLTSTTWVVSGSAQGGEIAFAILGISLQITTTPGQSAEQVTAALAAAIASEPGLVGISTEATGTTLVVSAPADLPASSDPGIQIDLPTAIPLLAPWVRGLLGLSLLLGGYAAARRRLPAS